MLGVAGSLLLVHTRFGAVAECAILDFLPRLLPWEEGCVSPAPAAVQSPWGDGPQGLEEEGVLQQEPWPHPHAVSTPSPSGLPHGTRACTP